MTMKRILTLIIGLALIGPAFAADDDPTPIGESQTITRLEPGGFTVTLEVTPVVKVAGVNSADTTTIYVEKWQVVRVLKDGVQVGQTRKESLGKRDCTTWFMERINPTTGLPVALAIAKGKGSWAAAGWNNSALAGE